jgi:hypothetical protein
MDDALSDMLTGFGAGPADVQAVLRKMDYPADPKNWTDDDRETLARLVRERTKPIVVVANKMDVAPAENVQRLMDLDKPVIPATAEGELALRKGAEAGVVDYDPGDADFDILGDVTDAQRERLQGLRDAMTEYGGTGVQAAIDYAVYDLLDRITLFPVQDQSKWTDAKGNVLPDAFLLPRESTPVDLAYAVHSDIGDGYLHAVDARSGRDIGEGRELEEGDVVKIVSTAS